MKCHPLSFHLKNKSASSLEASKWFPFILDPRIRPGPRPHACPELGYRRPKVLSESVAA